MRLPLAVLLAAINFVSCATAPKKTVDEYLAPKPFVTEAVSGFVFVEHKGKSFRVKGDFSVLSPTAIRSDITTGLDLPLASVLLTDDNTEYVLYREKKYFRGRSNPHALDRLFPLAVDAKRLVQVIREEKPTDSVCQRDEKDADSVFCKGQVDGVEYQVTWFQHTESSPWAGRPKKMILEIPSKATKIKFHFDEIRTNIQNVEALGQLRVPPGFKTYSVPKR